MRHQLGWQPDTPDHRDWHAEISRVAHRPVRTDFRHEFPKQRDQLTLGACTGFGITSVVQHVLKSVALSPLFVYYQERLKEHTVKSDAGGQARDGIKACKNIGVCLEGRWPYKIDNYQREPSSSAYKNAMLHRIGGYSRVNRLAGMRAALAGGNPVIFGISVYDSFESEHTALTGKVSMPKIDEPMIGGHLVFAGGYDDKAKHAICGNSWGDDWGDHGWFYLPYEYIENPDLSDDFWMVHK